MTKHEELERAVERLTADLTEPFGHFAGEAPESCALVRIEDARLILAANRKMREAFEEMLVIAALYLSSGDKTARRLKDAEFGSAMARAREALKSSPNTQAREGEGWRIPLRSIPSRGPQRAMLVLTGTAQTTPHGRSLSASIAASLVRSST